MKTIALKGDARTGLGKAETKLVRAAGKVPCVIYGGKENKHFAVYQADFKKLVYTDQSYKVQIDLDGKQHIAILKDLQFHPVSEEISHADFLEIDVTKAVNTTLPIKIEGTAPGVRSGGRLIKKYRKLRVNGLIADLPEFLIANIDALELGDSIRVRDLTTEGFDILEAPENAVISCKMTRAAISASGEEGEEGAEGEGTEEASAETVS